MCKSLVVCWSSTTSPEQQAERCPSRSQESTTTQWQQNSFNILRFTLSNTPLSAQYHAVRSEFLKSHMPPVGWRSTHGWKHASRKWVASTTSGTRARWQKERLSRFHLLRRSSQRENSIEAVALDVLGLPGHWAQCFFHNFEHELLVQLSQAYLTKKWRSWIVASRVASETSCLNSWLGWSKSCKIRLWQLDRRMKTSIWASA